MDTNGFLNATKYQCNFFGGLNIANTSRIKEKSMDKIAKTASRIKDALPYTTTEGKYNDETEKRPFWWTNSFWAGILWQMYGVTGKAHLGHADKAGQFMDLSRTISGQKNKGI